MVAAAGAKRVVIVGRGVVAGALAEAYRRRGDTVLIDALDDASGIEAFAAAGTSDALDMLVFADDPSGAAAKLDGVDRQSLRNRLERLTYLPFRLAAQFKPALAQSRGTLVLLSQTSATMEHPLGDFTDRLFRAASHALWRCFSVEWAEAGIRSVIVAMDGTEDAATLAGLPELIAARAAGDGLVQISDTRGGLLGW